MDRPHAPQIAPEQPPPALPQGIPQDGRAPSEQAADQPPEEQPQHPEPQTEPGQPQVATESSPSAPAPAPGSTSGGLIAIAILIGLCLAGGLVVMLVRRRLLGESGANSASESLMDSLRAMLRRGEISQEEFDAAKRSMVARMSGASRPGAGRDPGARAGDGG